MKKTIGIVAPFTDPKIKTAVDADFVLRVGRDSRELTLSCLKELCICSYDVTKLRSVPSYYDTIAAAGYYLSGLMRCRGYDTRLTAECDEAFFEDMKKTEVIAVCVSSTMILGRDSLGLIVNKIRKYLPGVKIVVGGVFVWKSYRWWELRNRKSKIGNNDIEPVEEDRFIFPCTKREIDADAFVITEDGTSALIDIISELEKGSSANLYDIPNIAIQEKDGNYTFTKREKESVNYESDFTRWDLIDNLPKRIPIRTSMGCAYRCRFCDFWYCYPKAYYRSKESLVSELRLIRGISRRQKMGSLLHFTDDNIFQTSSRVTEICDALNESKIGMQWISFMRANVINKDNVDMICRSGLALSQIGVESGDPEQLERMNKKLLLDDVKNTVELFDSRGKSTMLYFVVGFPGEDEETANGTVDFLNSIKIVLSSSGYQMFPLYITPLCAVSSNRFRKEWEIKGMWEKWSHKTMNSDQVRKVCFSMFREIGSIPYYYQDESTLANMGYTDRERKELFSLRHRLTIQLVENEKWSEIGGTFERIGRTMGLNKPAPGRELRDHIIVPRLD